MLQILVPDEIFSELKPHRNMRREIVVSNKKVLLKYNKAIFTLIYTFTKFNVEYIVSSNLANLIHYLRKILFSSIFKPCIFDYIIIFPYQYI